MQSDDMADPLSVGGFAHPNGFIGVTAERPLTIDVFPRLNCGHHWQVMIGHLYADRDQIDVGVLIAKGVALKIGDSKPHQFSYVACNPQRCEATMPMDETVIRQMIAGADGPAAITFWKADGADVTISIQSIKGIDKAIAAVR